jgi:hypothetical protein
MPVHFNCYLNAVSVLGSDQVKKVTLLFLYYTTVSSQMVKLLQPSSRTVLKQLLNKFTGFSNTNPGAKKHGSPLPVPHCTVQIKSNLQDLINFSKQKCVSFVILFFIVY